MSESENDQNKNNSNQNSDDQTRTGHACISGKELLPHHPRNIGHYKIKRVIASGGMGTVFEALQENPNRPVAIKIIKSNITSESAIKRLEYEAQMLARLRHPGIAQIYEAGTFEDKGQQTPYFAMEYIPNAKTIIEYAIENKLSSKARIELFLQVCDAIHHGHQRGIVHRDLKPSNILVESSGLVKVIDFGVARATDADMKQAAGLTDYGQLVRTVQYMSPEQFDADPHDIDIRSDVYALGLVLYELLSGSLPYNTQSEKIFDFASEVREGKTIPIGIKDNSFKGDLEAIIEMALQRDRENRYQSAYGVAQDIRRFVKGDAVIATRPGLSYQLKIFARKNKAIIGLVGAAFVVLLVAVVVTTSSLIKANEERAKAEVAKQKAKEGQQFLSDVLTESFPYGFGDKVTVLNILDRASGNLDGAFPDDPLMEGELRSSLGTAFSKIGHYDQARKEYEASLRLYNVAEGPGNDNSLSLYRTISMMHTILNKPKEKVKLNRERIKYLIERFGENNLQVINAKQGLAESFEQTGEIAAALATVEESWIIAKDLYGSDTVHTIDVQQQYAWLLLRNGRIEEAEEMAKDALKRSYNSVEDKNDLVRDGKSVLAATYIAQAKIDSAQALYGEIKAPESFGVEKVFQGELDLQRKPFQLLVFFETWCPFSKNAMRTLGTVDHQYSPLGLDIIGFTRVSKNAVDADVEPFLKELGASFAVVKENGRSWNYFDCSYTPSIRLLYKGNLIWEKGGYTNEAISTQMLEGLVEAQSCGFF